MPICKECRSVFSHRIIIEGVQKILTHRKRCLECLPWGVHNQRKGSTGTCSICGEERYVSNRRKICSKCTMKRRRDVILDRIHEVLGDRCWSCDYGGVEKRGVLDFHHVEASEKSFGVSSVAMAQINWTRICKEIAKCVLLCCRCHREATLGLLENHEIEALHQRKKPELERLVKMALLEEEKREEQRTRKYYCIDCEEEVLRTSSRCTVCDGKRQQRVTDEQIKASIKDGGTLSSTARKFNISVKAVEKRSKKLGLTTERQKNITETRRKVKALQARGMGSPRIAKELGISRGTAQHYMHRLNR